MDGAATPRLAPRRDNGVERVAVDHTGGPDQALGRGRRAARAARVDRDVTLVTAAPGAPAQAPASNGCRIRQHGRQGPAP
jgi:hypothetical protein